MVRTLRKTSLSDIHDSAKRHIAAARLTRRPCFQSLWSKYLRRWNGAGGVVREPAPKILDALASARRISGGDSLLGSCYAKAPLDRNWRCDRGAWFDHSRSSFGTTAKE